LSRIEGIPPKPGFLQATPEEREAGMNLAKEVMTDLMVSNAAKLTHKVLVDHGFTIDEQVTVEIAQWPDGQRIIVHCFGHRANKKEVTPIVKSDV
jgi:hypothetical protein